MINVNTDVKLESDQSKCEPSKLKPYLYTGCLLLLAFTMGVVVIELKDGFLYINSQSAANPAVYSLHMNTPVMLRFEPSVTYIT